jgi:hydroxymethylglutaryl-CoA lyase
MNPISRPITQTFSSPSIHCTDDTALPKMPVMKEKAPAYRKFLNDLPERVTIVEVGARDGLQNETKTVSNHVKIELINRFTQTGIKKIEVGSFVSPDWVPQMAGSAEVLAGITHKEGVEYSVLVPNMKGFKAAVAGEVLPEKMVIFGSASEVFSKKNINCSKAESMERFSEVARSLHHIQAGRIGLALVASCGRQTVELDLVSDQKKTGHKVDGHWCSF